MHSPNCKDEVFQKLDGLRKKYDRAERIRKSIQGQMQACYNELNWRNDKDLIQEIIDHLPEGYLRFLMYGNLFSLLEVEENNANGETLSQEGGEIHA